MILQLNINIANNVLDDISSNIHNSFDDSEVDDMESDILIYIQSHIRDLSISLTPESKGKIDNRYF